MCSLSRNFTSYNGNKVKQKSRFEKCLQNFLNLSAVFFCFFSHQFCTLATRQFLAKSFETNIGKYYSHNGTTGGKTVATIIYNLCTTILYYMYTK